MRNHDRTRFSTHERVGELLNAATGVGRDRTEIIDRAVAGLVGHDAAAVDGQAERRLVDGIATAWARGWQPVELARQLRRIAHAAAEGLALHAIAAEYACNSPASVDTRWDAQLVELQLPTVSGTDGWLTRSTRGVSREEQIRVVVSLLRTVVALPRIPTLIPPPGATGVDPPIIDLTAPTNDPVLNRVRALLAQAESTTFEAEAETFTAKAQELMTRHAIDIAMVAAGSRRSDGPGSIRIAVDEPYVEGKSLLLQVVAESSRCQAVFHQGLAMSSVVGFGSDLASTETLFTSLLVQAQVALRGTAVTASPGTRTRSRAFRSAFLMAYALRVGERLDDVNRHVVAEAESTTGRSVLPVLAARSAQVTETVGTMFGALQNRATRRRFDTEGWDSGRTAADRAQLAPAVSTNR